MSTGLRDDFFDDEDDEDEPFMDDTGSNLDADDFAPPSLGSSLCATTPQHSRRPSTISGSTGLSYPSDFLKMPPPPIPPSPSGLSPEIIARITFAELFHNPEFWKVHERGEESQRSVSMLLSQLFDTRRTANYPATSSEFFFVSLFCAIWLKRDVNLKGLHQVPSPRLWSR